MLSLNKTSPETKNNKTLTQQCEPLIIHHTNHTILCSHISPAALNVLYALKKAGYDAYLVGGCVRDLLLGHKPKDFDVTTNASPEQVHKIFKRSYVIGRRFKLVHISYGHEIIETSTFRAPPKIERHIDYQGRIIRDNVYGTLEQDAWRRDFTINALYFNIKDRSIIDYTGGIDDLRSGTIRLIGDVETRYREDPVRMLRAIRFAGKLGLLLDYETELWISKLAILLKDISPARLFDETLKLYLSGNATTTHQLLKQYKVFEHLFPRTSRLLSHEKLNDNPHASLLTEALINTDKRIHNGKSVTPAFLFAALLWEPVRQCWSSYIAAHISNILAMQRAAADVMLEQIQRIAIPKRYSIVTRSIWNLQPRLAQRLGQHAFQSLAQPKFRAGYDFLLLRNKSGEPLGTLTDWWTSFQEQNKYEQQKMIDTLTLDEHNAINKRSII